MDDDDRMYGLAVFRALGRGGGWAFAAMLEELGRLDPGNGLRAAILDSIDGQTDYMSCPGSR